MMPAKYSLDTIPKPRDQRITLEKVPEQCLAAIIYSWGRGFERNRDEGEELLTEALSFEAVFERQHGPIKRPLQS